MTFRKAYSKRRVTLCAFYNCDNLDSLFLKWYLQEKMSSPQIAEKIKNETNISFTNRSIQRILKSYNAIRSKKESFSLAISLGRMVHPLKEWKQKHMPISSKRRCEVFLKFNSRCAVCGLSANEGAIMEIDHIVPQLRGGTHELSNLQLLCHDCNKAKQYANKEFADVHNQRLNISNNNILVPLSQK